MQYQVNFRWTRRLNRFFALLFLCILPVAAAHAQVGNASNGKTLFTAVLATGKLSCANAQCHTANPTSNVNRIKPAGSTEATIKTAIARGIGSGGVGDMSFLNSVLTTQNIADLAAYIFNPAAATGGGGTPTAALSSAAVSFGSSTVGIAAATQTVTVSNTGAAALVLSGISTGSTEFVATGGTCTASSSIAATGSCTISLTFTPNAAGARSATLTVNHNAAGGTASVALSGTGTAVVVVSPAVAQINPAALSFAATAIAIATSSQAVTVSNTGGAALTLGATSLTGANSGEFSIAFSSCAASLVIAPGASCVISVNFTPSVVGARSATLSISHSASGSPGTVSLTGTGTPAVVVTNATKVMTEYRYVPLNYFFITSRDGDKAVLDTLANWQRTGQSFPVYVSQVANSQGINRFYFDKVAMANVRGSHFYTLLGAEIVLLQGLNPANTTAPKLPFDEGVDSYALLPVVEGVGGSCAAGQVPVYRLFRGNVRFPDDPNHRFTTSAAIYDEFVKLGWDGEGVKLCVPAQ